MLMVGRTKSVSQTKCYQHMILIAKLFKVGLLSPFFNKFVVFEWVNAVVRLSIKMQV